MDAHAVTDITIQSNKDYQQDVLDYTRDCQLRLKAVDSLLAEVAKLEDVRDELDEDPDEVPKPNVAYDGEVMIHVEGAVRAEFPSLWMNLRGSESPFYQDFLQSDRNKALTTVRPWVLQEVDHLKRAVIIQKSREVGGTAQSRGENPLVAMETADQRDLLRVGENFDWEGVAKTFATMSEIQPSRTAIECQIQYLTHDHPDVTKRSWTEEEQTTLFKTVEKMRDPDDGIDWNAVKDEHNSIFSTCRTIAQCLKIYRVGLKPSGKEYWTEEEDERLREAIDKFGTQNWAEVARHVSNRRSAQQARLHWLEVLDPTTKKGKWSEDEDNVLREAIRLFRHSCAEQGKPDKKIDWPSVAESVPGRTGPQCRSRWKNLDPNKPVRPWTSEENLALLHYVDREQRTFSEISRLHLLVGRTQAQCIEQYNLLTGKPEGSAAPLQRLRDSEMVEGSQRTSLPSTGQHLGSSSLPTFAPRDTMSHPPAPPEHQSLERPTATETIAASDNTPRPIRVTAQHVDISIQHEVPSALLPNAGVSVFSEGSPVEHTSIAHPVPAPDDGLPQMVIDPALLLEQGLPVIRTRTTIPHVAEERQASHQPIIPAAATPTSDVPNAQPRQSSQLQADVTSTLSIHAQSIAQSAGEDQTPNIRPGRPLQTLPMPDIESTTLDEGQDRITEEQLPSLQAERGDLTVNDTLSTKEVYAPNIRPASPSATLDMQHVDIGLGVHQVRTEERQPSSPQADTNEPSTQRNPGDVVGNSVPPSSPTKIARTRRKRATAPDAAPPPDVPSDSIASRLRNKRRALPGADSQHSEAQNEVPEHPKVTASRGRGKRKIDSVDESPINASPPKAKRGRPRKL